MTETPNTQPEQTPAAETTAEQVGSAATLEQVLIEGRDGKAQAGEIIRAFLTSSVYFLSPEEVSDETGSVNPLTLQDNEGNPLIALFSTTGNIPEDYKEHAPHAVEAPGVAIVQSITGAGIMIDAGQEHGFQISAEGVERIRTDFISPAEDAEAQQ
ncbi:SseB family protein [Nesterenkonia sp. E16_7]|uniref:SseB family protein n=1 Tax=unclassified Nesterenkonia TaxID=2629769 RepID=UPI001A92751F|nr:MULTISPECIES: SseB family protein [unclassified Nesterenkonia]MBO0595296.1 SseB family protein [Nesterenkonia sp. E16_10]MBO0598051.1 SseB family protein [Nesterenkonia sp. E16_7]